MQKYKDAVAKHRQLILDALDYIWKNPETGYKEWKTHAYLEEAFAKLGYELTLAGDIPGFTALLDTGREGPTIAVFGEMDSLICENHPDADPETGAVHSCGHCAQAAALLGLAAALTEPGILDEMCGKILLVAVPAEELIEIEYREALYKKGIIKYFGGKPEFMSRGLLDGVDMAMMIHTSSSKDCDGSINGGGNGCIAKSVTFEGVSAHAGGAPHLGVNALYAANLGLNAINALRETFQDANHVRVHPIITAGGKAVNAIPDEVRLESYVRGATMASIIDANRKVNRALAASAAALGAKVHLRDIPGYCPRVATLDASELMKAAMEQVLDRVAFNPSAWGGGSTDMGDVSTVMPALHPYVAGAEGTAHSNEYRIVDPEKACVKSAQVQLVFLAMALGGGAEKAKSIIANYKPVYSSIAEYLECTGKLNLDMQAVEYGEDGKITLQFEEV